MLSPRSNGSLTEEEINRALDDEFQHDLERDGDSASSDSGGTVHGQAVLSPSLSSYKGPGSGSNFEFGSGGGHPEYTETVRRQVALSSSHKGHGSVSSRSNFGFEIESGQPGYFMPRYGSSLSSESSRLLVSQQRRSPASTKSSPDTWRIHFKKPPGSSVMLEGPIPWKKLESSLGLDDDKVGVEVSIP